MKDAKREAKETAKRELKRREGLRNRYFGGKAIEELDKELDKMNATP